MVNQSYPFEVSVIYSIDNIDANSSCSFTKEDLTFKQVHLVSSVSFCAMNQVLTVIACFQCFLWALSRNNLILHQNPMEKFSSVT